MKCPHRVFKIGAPVVITTNICKTTGIVNNAFGTLFDVYYANLKDKNPKILFVKLENFRGISVHKTEPNIVPIVFPTIDKDRSNVFNFNLSLAFPMTSHKSQGCSIDWLCVNLGATEYTNMT